MLIDTLQQIVDLCGPRPAGSRSEDKLKQFISEQLLTQQYSILRHQVGFSPFPALLSEQFIQASLLIILTLSAFRFPIIGLLIPFIITLAPRLLLQIIRGLPGKLSTENIIALNQSSDLTDVKLLLVAHMDTANAHPIEGKFIKFTLRSFFYSSYLISLLSLTNIMEFQLPEIFRLILLTYPLIHAVVIIIYQLLVTSPQKTRYSPGANDNASGVAVLLELAKDDDIKRMPVGFLFTSAEEDGLFGAAFFIKQFPRSARHPVIINVDSVGAGDELGLVSSYGRLWSIHTSKQLNYIIRSVDPSLSDIRHFHRAGDYLPFCEAGFNTVSLEAALQGGTPPEYHTTEDKAEHINPEILTRAYKTLLDSIFQLKERSFEV